MKPTLILYVRQVGLTEWKWLAQGHTNLGSLLSPSCHGPHPRGKAKVLRSILKATHNQAPIYTSFVTPHSLSLGHNGFLALPKNCPCVWTFKLAVPTSWNTSLLPISALLIPSLPCVSAQMSPWRRGLPRQLYLSLPQPGHSLSSSLVFILWAWHAIFTDFYVYVQEGDTDGLSTLLAVISMRTGSLCVLIPAASPSV